MKESVFLCLLFVFSLASAKQLCTTRYSDPMCQTAIADPDCAPVDECLQGSATLSSMNTCDGDTYTTTTYANGDCSGSGTVAATGSLELCVTNGQTSSMTQESGRILQNKEICSIVYNDTMCENAVVTNCAPVDKCIQASATLSSMNTCDGDTYTTTTYANGDCSGSGTVVDTGTLELCVTDGYYSSKISCAFVRQCQCQCAQN